MEDWINKRVELSDEAMNFAQENPELFSHIVEAALIKEAQNLIGYTHEFRDAFQMLQRCTSLMVRDASYIAVDLQR